MSKVDNDMTSQGHHVYAWCQNVLCSMHGMWTWNCDKKYAYEYNMTLRMWNLTWIYYLNMPYEYACTVEYDIWIWMCLTYDFDMWIPKQCIRIQSCQSVRVLCAVLSSGTDTCDRLPCAGEREASDWIYNMCHLNIPNWYEHDKWMWSDCEHDIWMWSECDLIWMWYEHDKWKHNKNTYESDIWFYHMNMNAHVHSNYEHECEFEYTICMWIIWIQHILVKYAK
jgi:hypothetical protein